MSLRTRLLLGYGYLILLLILTAGSAALGFYQISGAIDAILRENFQSVTASVEMLESLERQNTLTLVALVEGEDMPPEIDERHANFLEALQRAEGNLTMPGEEEVVASIRSQYDVYLRARAEVVSAHPARALRAYHGQVFPPYLTAKEAVFELLDINHRAIIAADREARATALQTAGWLGLLVTIALVSMAILARLMQREILNRLSELTDTAEAILAGEQTRRFKLHGKDELAVVARQLNAALDTQDELQTQMRGRLNQQKQLVLGMLDRTEHPALLIGLDAEVIASTWEDAPRPTVVSIADELTKRRKDLLNQFRDRGELAPFRMAVDLDHEVEVCLLTAEGRRPVGWLATLHDKDSPVPTAPDDTSA